MFESYSKSQLSTGDKRGLLTSTFAAFGVYGLGAAALLLLAREVVTTVEKPVSVIFAPPGPAPQPAQKPSAPPPPKPSRPKRAAAPKVAPTPPPPETPPTPAPEPQTPTAMPTAPAPEAEPTAVATGDHDGSVGLVDPNGTGGSSGAPGALGGTGSGPINLPPGATQPRPSRSNRLPELPRSARAQGLEGTVILRFVVTQDGKVTDIVVLKGEEPFASAAVEAVRTWRYDSPPMVNGRAVAAYKVVKIPFVLSGNGRSMSR